MRSRNVTGTPGRARRPCCRSSSRRLGFGPVIGPARAPDHWPVRTVALHDIHPQQATSSQRPRSPSSTRTSQPMRHGAQRTPPVYFVDGTPVPSSDRVNYLSSHLTWSNPTQRAIDARKALAHTRYMKLQLVWRSRLSRATKVKIYQASIVPALT